VRRGSKRNRLQSGARKKSGKEAGNESTDSGIKRNEQEEDRMGGERSVKKNTAI